MNGNNTVGKNQRNAFAGNYINNCGLKAGTFSKTFPSVLTA